MGFQNNYASTSSKFRELPDRFLGTTPGSNGSMRFFVGSSNSGSAVFTTLYSFKKGDIPSTSGVVVTGATAQVIPRNYWPDGSLKFAEISGTITLTAGIWSTVTLAVGTSSTGTALATSVLQSTLTQDIVISASGIGSATWTNSDLATPFKTWTTGHQMSSWIYRKAVGSDAHLTAWLEVRLYAGGKVEILPWIENGYIQVDNPTSKSTTYSFSMEGSSRYSGSINLKHHQRTVLINGSNLSYWNITDPNVVIKHDVTYLQNTEVVPTYRASVSVSMARVTAQPSTYTPLQQGSFNYDSDNMASSGYQTCIGLLPEHDVLYLVSDANTLYASIIRNGFSAGRYGTHYRDENTNKPLRFSDWPTLVASDSQGLKDNGASTTSTYTDPATGGNPISWDHAHHPSMGFMAYLLTGRFYFLEECQFVTTANYITITDWIRGGGSSGSNFSGYTGADFICQAMPGAVQTRAAAWNFRSLVQALAITPDSGDNLRAEYINAVEKNCAFMHARYVAQTNNPFGWVQPGEDYGYGLGTGAAWQQDFYTAAWGYGLALDLPINSTAASRMSSFFAWKAKSITMRMETSSGFWYINANRYTLTISSNNNPDYITGTGPWRANNLECYTATAAYATGDNLYSSTEGLLAQEFDSVAAAKGLWGDLQMALAYAVRWSVPNAAAGYTRMTQVSNWTSMLASQWDAYYPVLAVKPNIIGSVLPAWWQAAPIGQFVEVTNSSAVTGTGLAQRQLNAFCGFAVDEINSKLYIPAWGGHDDGQVNSTHELNLLSDPPTFTKLHDASPSFGYDVVFEADGQPAASHTYQYQFVCTLNIGGSSVRCIVQVGTYGAHGSGGGPASANVNVFNLTTNTWYPENTFTDIPIEFNGGWGYGVLKIGGDKIFTQAGRIFDPATQTWSAVTMSGSSFYGRFPYAWDNLRNRIFAMQWGDSQGYDGGTIGHLAYWQDPTTGVATPISWDAGSSAAISQFASDAPQYPAMDYDRQLDKFYFYHGKAGLTKRVYIVTPQTSGSWNMTVSTLPGDTPPESAAGIQRRFVYIPTLKGFYIQPDALYNGYFLRTA